MSATFQPTHGPRIRLISDNDYAGDPDGLVQLVHHLLSPSVDIRALVGSHLAPGDPFEPSDHTADSAHQRILKVLDLMGLDAPSCAGSNDRLVDLRTPRPSAAAEVIIREALRDDTDLPLYVTLGAGLTDLASAYLLEPRIADRLTAVWIGGSEYPDLAVAPPGSHGPEYNLNIDITAAQVIFNESPIRLWQVPRNVYRQCLVSMTELYHDVRPMGAIGEYLYEKILSVHQMAGGFGVNLGETYILGDSPLVLLTALQSCFEPDPSSSSYVLRPAPRINDDGSYTPRADGRDIRVYTQLDNRILLSDLFKKIAANAA